jgi:hypothetical protein
VHPGTAELEVRVETVRRHANACLIARPATGHDRWPIQEADGRAAETKSGRDVGQDLAEPGQRCVNPRQPQRRGRGERLLPLLVRVAVEQAGRQPQP